MQNYKNKHIREVCHGVKENDKVAINEMADYFMNLDLINGKSILVPAPNHQGFAMYTKEISEIIAKNTGATVCDVLKCIPHEMLYQQKKKGVIHKPTMYLTSAIKEGTEIYFVDNVIDTGMTFFTARQLLGHNLKSLIYASANKKFQ